MFPFWPMSYKSMTILIDTKGRASVEIPFSSHTGRWGKNPSFLLATEKGSMQNQRWVQRK